MRHRVKTRTGTDRRRPLADKGPRAGERDDNVPAPPPVFGVAAAAASASSRACVAIVDKNPMVRAGLADYIGRDARFSVAGVAATGGEFIDLCGGTGCKAGVAGWSLPDMTGGDVLATLKRRQSATRIVIYTGETNPRVLRQAIKAGAWGFMSKSDEPSLLLDTIATVSRGRLCLPYVDLQSLGDDPLEALTARERELLAALAQGWTNLQVAARIGISKNTVKYHLKNLYDKIGVKNRAMAVALFMSAPRDFSPAE